MESIGVADDMFHRIEYCIVFLQAITMHVLTYRVAWSLSVCLCISVLVTWVTEPYKNGWTNQDAIWGSTCVAPSNHVLEGVNMVTTWWIQLNNPF